MGWWQILPQDSVTHLLRITTSHLCAGAEITASGLVVRTAPILRPIHGLPLYAAVAYAKSRNWNVELLPL